MLRFTFNFYKAVTFVLINVFRCGKKYVVGIGEKNARAELIKGFVVNFEPSFNVNAQLIKLLALLLYKRPTQLQQIEILKDG